MSRRPFLRSSRVAGLAILFSMGAGSTAFALTPDSTKALAEENRELDAVADVVQRLKAALVPGEMKLKPGVDPASLVADARKVADALVAASEATSKISKSDYQDPAVKAAQEKFAAAKILLIKIGYAAPGAFLSPAGKRQLEGCWGLIKTMNEYRAEIEAGKTTRLHDFDIYLNRIHRMCWKRLSPRDRTSANGLAFYNELFLAAQFEERVRKQMSERAQTGATARVFCNQFAEKYRHNKYVMDLVGLLLEHRGPWSYRSLNDQLVKEWVKRIHETLAAAKAMVEDCHKEQSKKYLPMCKPVAPGETHFTGLYAKRDPFVWCKAAEQARDLLLLDVQNHVEETSKSTSGFMRVNRIEPNEGWFSDDLLRGWKEMFTVSEKWQRGILDRYKAIFQAIGASMPDPSVLFAARRKQMAAIRKEVSRLAPTWGLPPKGRNFYGVSMAKRAIRQAFRHARIIKAHGAPGGWAVTKNWRGIPKYRDRSGWILFRVPGEPFCQLRKFIISENYVGHHFKRANHVVFSSVRWQKCK